MVQEVRMFKTDDGKQFSDFDSALKHEADVKSAEFITRQFPDHSKLSRGDFYQLTASLVEGGRTMLCNALRNRNSGSETFNKALDAYEDNPRCDLIGRLLCDGSSAFYGAWLMFESIDDRNRMFSQPYFVINTDAVGKQIPFD